MPEKRGRRGPGACWVAVALVLAMGCREPRPALRPLAPEAVVLAFGDSLTRGTGAEPGESYPARLEALLGRRVINAGVPGEVTSQGLGRLAGALRETEPALVLLCHGGNDLLRRYDRGALKANLEAMVRLAWASGAEVVLLGVPNPGVFTSPPPLYPDLARELNIPYEGEIWRQVLTDPARKADAIHANAEGYRAVAEAVAALLSRAGARP